jgi:hypothetical protein
MFFRPTILCWLNCTTDTNQVATSLKCFHQQCMFGQPRIWLYLMLSMVCPRISTYALDINITQRN